MNGQPIAEPWLSADFAERVLRLADRRLVHRRKMRWIVGATCLSVSLTAIISWINFISVPGPAAFPRRPTLASAPDGLEAANPRDNSADALSYMFPDAEPLARFAAESDEGDGSAEAGSPFDENVRDEDR